jgi:hypothetical protein
LHAPWAINVVSTAQRDAGLSAKGFGDYIAASKFRRNQMRRLFGLPKMETRLWFATSMLLSNTIGLAAPPWVESTVGGETYSWGRVAVGGTTLGARPSPQIWVIDGGVAAHQDLNVVDRVNSIDGLPTIGCHAHATHVAGIIAARAGNGTGVVGVLAGAEIRSMSVATRPSSDQTCVLPNLDEPNPVISVDKNTVIAGINKVRSRLVGQSQAAIVNISLNGAYFADQDVKSALLALATPATNYPGAFIAQAAGNNGYYILNGYSPTCDVVYAPSVPTDGIMVVGGINADGSMTGNYFTYPYTNIEGGTNVGTCVDVYAPARGILSTWGQTYADVPFDSTTVAKWTKSGTTYSATVRLEGTSMAAPHVAGVAAATLAAYPSLAPSEIESAVRGQTYQLSSGFPMAQLGDLSADSDGDQMPDVLEKALGRNWAAKDNDVYSSARLFAMQQYRDFLGREGDPSGIKSHVDSLMSGTKTPAQVIQNFYDSNEFAVTVSPIARLYFGMFLRFPDYAGLLFQVDAYRTGTPLTVIANNFTQSPEFQSLYGNKTNAEYVALLYQNILGRSASQAEIDFHLNRLATGSTRGEVLLGFSESPEFIQLSTNDVYVALMYIGMLRRTPDQSGFDYHVNRIESGISRLEIINGFFGSPEYHNRFCPTTTTAPNC